MKKEKFLAKMFFIKPRETLPIFSYLYKRKNCSVRVAYQYVGYPI